MTNWTSRVRIRTAQPDQCGSPASRSCRGVTRRRFLPYTALGTAAAAAAGCHPADRLSPVRAAVRRRPRLWPKGWSGTIADLKHVVILMQREPVLRPLLRDALGSPGFGDKQILAYQNGTSIFQQPDPGSHRPWVPAPV